MQPQIMTWNSININNDVTKDGTAYRAYIPPPQMANQSNNPVLVNRSNEYPFLSTAQRNPSFITINVIIDGDLNTYRETLKKYFFSDLNKHNLVIRDRHDSDRQYYRSGIPITMTQEGNNINSFLISIQTDFPYWELVTPSADSWDITATGDSDVITNIGNINVHPVFTITPTSTKAAGLKYRRYLPIYNVLDKSYNVPIDVVNNGLDSASLISGNKMISGGTDLRVWMDGNYADRWIDNVASSDSDGQVWVNYAMQPRKYGTFSTAFDSDDTTLYFGQTKSNLKFLQSIIGVKNRTLQIDSDSDNGTEFITYSDSDIDTIQYTIANLSRGQKDSTAITHLANGTVRLIEHDTWLLYGDSDATPWSNDDSYKPLFDLNGLSTNAIWNYSGASFFDENNLGRTGNWKPGVLSTRTGLSYIFTGSENTFINPANVLGMALIGSADFQVQNESGTLAWEFNHPAGVTKIEYDGEKYRSGSFPAIIGLQALQPNTVWLTIQNKAQPTNAYEWEYFDHTAGVDLGGIYETLRFVIDGLLSSVINEMALIYMQVYGIYFDTDNLAQIAMGNETSINFFDFTLKNNTTGEYIKVTTPCLVNSSLTIDCDKQEAYLADGTRVNVITSTDREEWLDLQPGTNNLQYDDVGTAGINVVISHRDRVL